jgi:hypothetical protein
VAYAFSDKAKIWQSAEYLPKANDFGDYLLSAEVGAEAAMNSRVSLRIVLQDKYDSTPAIVLADKNDSASGSALNANDLTLIAGVAIKL